MNVPQGMTARNTSDHRTSARRHVWQILWQQLLADASTRIPAAIREQADDPEQDDSERDTVLALATCGEEERHFL